MHPFLRKVFSVSEKTPSGYRQMVYQTRIAFVLCLYSMGFALFIFHYSIIDALESKAVLILGWFVFGYAAVLLIGLGLQMYLWKDRPSTEEKELKAIRSAINRLTREIRQGRQEQVRHGGTEVAKKEGHEKRE